MVVHHVALVARPSLDTKTVGDAWWWITSSPLGILTSGHEFVLVFFVLSGLVVALPAIRDGFAWSKYYVTRLLRLYIPVWASLGLSAAFIVLFPRDSSLPVQDSWLASTNATTVTVAQWLADASLTRAGYDLNNVLWSLRWEIVFSLLLPLFVWVALRLRRHARLAFGVGMAGTVAGVLLGNAALSYLPLFFAGTVMAVRITELHEWAARRGPRFWLVTSIASVTVMTLSNQLVSWGLVGGGVRTALSGLSGLGAAGLVLCAIGSPAWQAFLTARVPAFLGKISFSLYLVQVPLIATVGYLVGDTQWMLVAAIALPLSVLVAWVFYRVVEQPSQRLARSTGQFAAARLESRSFSLSELRGEGMIDPTMLELATREARTTMLARGGVPR